MGIPTCSASFTLDNPGKPEAASEVILNLPEGLFGNPNAIPRCTPADFALQQCQTASQAGIVTIYANNDPEKIPSKGYPEYNLLGTAPVYDVEPQSEEETARLAFHRARG